MEANYLKCKQAKISTFTVLHIETINSMPNIKYIKQDSCLLLGVWFRYDVISYVLWTYDM